MNKPRKAKLFVSIISVLVICICIICINTYDSSIVKADSIPTSRISVHDPSIIKDNNKYYIFGSHMAWASSTDLKNWSSFKNNINTDYASIFSKNVQWSSQGSATYNSNGNMWAPDVIYNKSMRKYCMYMSVNGDKHYSSIAMAVADQIEGPYTYEGTIVYSGFVNSAQAAKTDYSKVTGTTNIDNRYLSNSAWNSSYGTNAIDPCVIYDKNDNLWMSYGSWFGGIYLLKLDNNTGLRDYTYTYPTQQNYSDTYFGKKLSGGYGCTGEGSYIVYNKETDYYYLYISYCGLNSTDSFSGYHIRMFRSKYIAGPYTDAAGNTGICVSSREDQTQKGIKLFGNYTLSSLKNVNNGELSANGYMSGGHNSAFVDDTGNNYLVYHTRFNNKNEYHQVRVHQQFINEDGWPVTAVYENLGSTMATYSNSEVTGTYDFINHGSSATTAHTDLLPLSKVTLNADGTISGDFSGKWTKNNNYCTMIINNVTYKGVFFKQYDESASHNNVMTFSLIGNNNQSIWGSMTSTLNKATPQSSNISDKKNVVSKDKQSSDKGTASPKDKQNSVLNDAPQTGDFTLIALILTILMVSGSVALMFVKRPTSD